MTETQKKPVAVDGAELFLGRAVVKALLGQGIPVRAMVANDTATVQDHAERVVVPLGDAEAMRKAVAGARAVVAARKLLEERPRDGVTFWTAHVERTSDLLAAAEAAGVERFVYVGVAGIDGRGSGRLADAEKAAEAYLAASKLPTLALRASLVAGPGDGHISRLARKARRLSPALVFVGQGWAKSAPVTVRDFAGCVVGALVMPITTKEFSADAVSIGGPEVLTAMDIQDRLLAHFGRHKLKVHLLESIARLGAMVAETIFRRPPVSRARLAWLLAPSIPDRVASTKLLGRRPDRFEAAFAGKVFEQGCTGCSG